MTAFDIDVSTQSDMPKYRQIMAAVESGVREGCLAKGESLPSINEVAARHGLARETVVKAYAGLKEKGLIDSRPGKGFFVATSHYSPTRNVFVLFDVLLTPYKERLHDGICAALQGRAKLDFCYHHHNPEVFCKLLADARGRYEYYVVMPFSDPKVQAALGAFDQEKLLLLDIDVTFPGKRCSVIRQSHDTELERALSQGLKPLHKYRGLTLVFPEDRFHPVVIKTAFRRFCRRHKIPGTIVEKLHEKDLRPRRAYLVIEDSDLVTLVKYLRANGLRAGGDIGIISYNDTPFKEIIEGGITCVSIDFHEMGRKAAAQILSPKKIAELVPTELIARASL